MLLLIIVMSAVPLISGAFLELHISTPKKGTIGPTINANLLDYTVHMNTYGINLIGTTWVKFQVKACANANILLSTSNVMDSAQKFYEVVFGGYSNQKSCFGRRENNSLQSGSWFQICILATSSLILPSCTTFKDFWLSWKNGFLQIGVGSVIDRNVMENWTDPNPVPLNIAAFGISTTLGSSGEWKIMIDDLFSGHYTRCGISNRKANLLILQSIQGAIKVCAAVCSQKSACMGFNCNPLNTSCELLSFTQSALTAIPKSTINGWNFYTKCFRERQWCLGCYF